MDSRVAEVASEVKDRLNDAVEGLFGQRLIRDAVLYNGVAWNR